MIDALGRVRQIVPEQTPVDYNVGLLSKPAEVALLQAFRENRSGLFAENSLSEFIKAGKELTRAYHRFLCTNSSNGTRSSTSRRQLGLLASIRDQCAGIVNWQALGNKGLTIG